MTAISVTDFVNSIGVNTHLDFSSTYRNTSLVKAEIGFLGLDNVRDAMASPADPALFAQFAAETGVKFDVYLSSGLPYDGQISQLAANLGFVRFVEGINESDTWPQSYQGLSGFAATQAVQGALYTAMKAAGNVPVIAPSYGNLSTFAIAPDSSATSDYGNTHEYFGTGNPPISGISTFIADADLVSGGAPVIATEAGYYVGPSLAAGAAQFAASGVDEAVQAKYDLTLLFDDWQAGISVTYLYELMDAQPDPNNTDFRFHYGLFNADGTPRLAATAIHDLTAILADPGPSRSGDTLGYQITGLPSTGNSLLMEKSSGAFDLALWNDIRLWSATAPAEVNNPLPPITLNFGQIVRSVVEYDPLTGTAPVASWSNVNLLNLSLPDHPVIFEVTPFPPGQLSLVNYVTPTSLGGGQSTGNLWAQILANAVETNPNWAAGLAITAVQTTATTGTVTFNSTAHSLIYTAPAYNAFSPSDSFSYTITDGHGGSVTGTVAITELPAANTTYAMTAGASYTAPASGWTMISLATGQSLRGSAAGGVTFIANTDTKIYAPGSNNIIQGRNGNFYAGAGADNARITLGDGNNTISVTGVGAVITTGNGNNIVWRPTGSATITMGNGNQSISAGGANNIVSIGTGVSTISLGTDGLPAGNEHVTVAGGTNTITVGGANDLVHLLGGTGNKVVSTGGAATILIDTGVNTLNIQGAANVVTANSGTNVINTSGAGNIVHGGSGSDTIWAGGDNAVITAGAGVQFITVTGHHDTIDLTAGTDTLTENGSGNTIVLAAPGRTAAQINGNVVALNDLFDLRKALAATTWGGYPDLANYLSVRAVGATSIIAIDSDGTGPIGARDIAVLNNSAGLTYQSLIAHALLPSINSAELTLTQPVLVRSLLGRQSTGNLWAQILATAAEAVPSWAAGLAITAVQTTATTGTVTFNSTAHSLIYTAPAYNAFSPSDSFSYTITDGHGGSVTGTVAITELPAANTTYAMAAGASYIAPASGWTVISLATGQSLRGSAAGGVTFIANTDTKIYAPGSNNTIQGGNGNFYAGAGADNARITLGDGNNTISVTGVGAVITTGNGNNLVWRPTGSATITMGNGNQSISAGGANNIVSIGTGVSSISLGTDGLPAGNERVTVAGGTNTITVGGANDLVHLLGGAGNKVVSTGGGATIIADSGVNTLNIQGTANIVTANSGTNAINTSGAGNIVHGGSGSDTIWAGGDYAVITAGAGVQFITVNGHHDTIDLTAGTDTLTENGSGNTIVLAAPGRTAAQINGNVVALNDLFDLRKALAATTWTAQSSLANYLSVRAVGATSIIAIDSDGTGPIGARDIAVLKNSAGLTYQGLLAHSITG